MSRKKILWLCSWYPDRVQPYNGDFVQRHAKAAALYNDIYVVHVAGDENAAKEEHIIRQHEGITEHIVYYKKSSGIVGRLFSFQRWQRINKRIIIDYFTRNGIPDMVHVHVAMPSGIIALWLKRRYNLDYILLEHWTGYLSDAKDNLFLRPFWYRSLLKRVIKEAVVVETVSDFLGKAIQRFVNIRYQVIPNVVDTDVFRRINASPSLVTQFIHISTLTYQKNPEAIFEAFGLAKKNLVPFKLLVVGNDTNEANRLSEQFDITNEVKLYNEMPQMELSRLIQESDALVLFSRYETFGCVIIEANACGKPVIVSDIPAMREIVKDKVNGVFVKENDVVDLAKRIEWFSNNKCVFDSAEIAVVATAAYNYATVGMKFYQLYDDLIKKEK